MDNPTGEHRRNKPAPRSLIFARRATAARAGQLRPPGEPALAQQLWRDSAPRTKPATGRATDGSVTAARRGFAPDPTAGEPGSPQCPTPRSPLGPLKAASLVTSAAGRPAAQIEASPKAQHGRERRDGASPDQRSEQHDQVEHLVGDGECPSPPRNKWKNQI